MLEGVKRVARHRRDIGKACGISQRVKVDHLVAARHRQPNHSRSDKSGAACHKDFHGLIRCK